jgi:hypothetical protein
LPFFIHATKLTDNGTKSSVFLDVLYCECVTT